MLKRVLNLLYLSFFLWGCSAERKLETTVTTPILNFVSSQSIGETDTLDIDVETAAGSDKASSGHAVTYTCFYDMVVDTSVASSTLCSTLGVIFNSATGKFNWTPSYTQGDSNPDAYEFKVVATVGGKSSETIFTVSVLNTDAAPVLEQIADRSVSENAALLQIDAGDGGDDLDADGDTITYSCYYDTAVDASVAQVTTCTTLAGLSFNSTTGVLDWTPDYTQSGVYEMMIVGSEGSLSGSEIFVVTVNNVDRPPVLSAITDFVVNEGQASSVVQTVDGTDSNTAGDTDVDGEAITYTCYFDNVSDDSVSNTNLCTGLAGNASFNTATGVFDWTPGYRAGDSGAPTVYEIKITATANGASDSVYFDVSVNDSTAVGFAQPLLDAIDDINVIEGSPISTVDAGDDGDDNDADGDPITYDCYWDTTVDASVSTAQTCDTLPGTVSFTQGGSDGVLTWTPSYTAGDLDPTEYEIRIDGTESGDTDTLLFAIYVTNNTNPDAPPLIDNINNQTVAENVAITQINVNDGGDDADADTDALTYSCHWDTTFNGSVDENTAADCSTLPGTVDWNTGLDGVLDWTPSYSAGGASSTKYELKFIADEGDLQDSKIVVITVTNDPNAPPVLDTIANQTVNEGVAIATVDANDDGDDKDADNENLTYACFYETDGDGTVNTLTAADCSGLTGPLSFNTTTGVLDWTPAYNMGSVTYDIGIEATEAGAALTDVVVFTVTVNDIADAPPFLVPESNQGVLAEGVNITQVDIHDYVDPGGLDLDGDGHAIKYTCYYDTVADNTVATTNSCDDLPGYPSFDTDAGTLDWEIGYASTSGGLNADYEFLISATDTPAGSGGSDEVIFVVSISDYGNDSPPQLETISDQIINEGEFFVVDANDGGDDNDTDSDAINYTCVYNIVNPCTGLPGKVSWDSSTGRLIWIPDSTAGDTAPTTYAFAITGSSTGSSTIPANDTISFNVDVNDTAADLYPYLDDISDQTVNEGVAITTVDANDGGDNSDADPEAIASFTCDFDTVVDGEVLATNDCATNLPALSISFDSVNGILDWTPNFNAGDSGPTIYEFKISAIDGDQPSYIGVEIFTITINDVADAPPVITIDTGGTQAIAEASAITQVNVNDSGDDNDADGNALTYTCQFDRIDDDILALAEDCEDDLPGLVSFDAATGVLDWIPNYNAANAGPDYEIYITANDDGIVGQTDVVSFDITVSDTSFGNEPPFLDLIADQTVTEGQAITDVDVNDNTNHDDTDATDPAADNLTYTCTYDTSLVTGVACSSLPGSANFDTGTGVLSWIPGFNSTTFASENFDFTVTANDGNGNMVGATFTITVNNYTATDAPPLLTLNIEDQTVNEGVSITTVDVNDLTADNDEDYDTDTITYSCYYDKVVDSSVALTKTCNSLTGVVFNSAAGTLAWTPSTGQGDGNPTYEFLVIGNEGDLTDQVYFTITVTDVSNQGLYQIETGNDFACGLRADGQAFCWGDNGDGSGLPVTVGEGMLGNGDDTDLANPTTGSEVDQSSSGSFRQLAVGHDHACGLNGVGEIWCWGDNATGELGDGTTTGSASPVQVVGSSASSFVTVSTGHNFTCAILDTGGVECWGNNSSGQLGDNLASGASSTSPVVVNGSLIFATIDAGDSHICGIEESGTIYCWGENGDGSGLPVAADEGMLGDGTDSDQAVPTQISNTNLKFVSVSAGYRHTCAIADTGDAYCWGDNTYSELGDATTTNSADPVGMNLASLPGKIPKKIQTGYYATCLLMDNGNVYCLGKNGDGIAPAIAYEGMVGDGLGADVDTPTLIDMSTNSSDSYIVDLSMGLDGAVCAVGSYGQPYCWGDFNASYMLSPTSVDISDINILNIFAFNSISAGKQHVCSTISNGEVACWGNGNSSQHGNNTSAVQNTPVYVTTGTQDYQQIDSGANHSCGLNDKGEIYCWGVNSYGQIGDGSTTEATIPTKVSNGGVLFKNVSAGGDHTCALTADGAIYCWGRNNYGQLGNSSQTNSKTPVLVSGAVQFKTVSAGNFHTCGVDSEGKIYCWGYNFYGQLGDSSTTTRTSPVEITSANLYRDVYTGISHTCAILTDNTAECWGRGIEGQLGDSLETTSSSAVVVSSGTYSKLALGRFHTCGLLTTGGINCWGYNGDEDTNIESSEGMLGTGDDIGSNIPASVDLTGIDPIKDISAGDYFSCAITASGQAYCWGDNTHEVTGTSDDANELPQAVSTALPQ